MQNEIKYLELSEVQNLLNSISNFRDKLIFHLIFTYGLRATELLNLKLEDIDLEKKIIKILPLKRRAKSKQNFPIDSRTLEMLTKWINELRGSKSTSYLFYGRKYINGEVINDQMSYKTIYKMFSGYCKKAGIHKNLSHPHMLRHSFAVAMAEKGVDIYKTKEFLRHTSLRSTEVYYNITNKRRNDDFLLAVESMYNE